VQNSKLELNYITVPLCQNVVKRHLPLRRVLAVCCMDGWSLKNTGCGCQKTDTVIRLLLGSRTEVPECIYYREALARIANLIYVTFCLHCFMFFCRPFFAQEWENGFVFQMSGASII
jgi:hypothetical protein